MKCEEIVFKDCDPVIWSKEQCAGLIELLKPRSVALNSDHDDRYEAIIENPRKITKSVDVTVQVEHTAMAMRRFLSDFEQVTLFTTSPTPISLLRSTLQQFLAQPYPHVTDFTFIVMRDDLDSKNGLLQEFSELTWTKKKVDTYYNDGIAYHQELSATVPLPPNFPPGFTCKLVVYWPYQPDRYDYHEVYFNIFYEAEETAA